MGPPLRRDALGRPRPTGHCLAIRAALLLSMAPVLWQCADAQLDTSASEGPPTAFSTDDARLDTGKADEVDGATGTAPAPSSRPDGQDPEVGRPGPDAGDAASPGVNADAGMPGANADAGASEPFADAARPSPACGAATAPCAGETCCEGLVCGRTTLGQVCCGLEDAPCATVDGADCCGDLLCQAGRCVAPAVCREARTPCDDDGQCCGDLSCGRTTLGQVCCGEDGVACATPNGEDCCGDRLCVDGRCVSPAAGLNFKAPFPCGQSWTYDHHAAEVRLALDFIRNDGPTGGELTLASAAGTAYQRNEPGGAGLYIVIDHGGGWSTYYFHLSDFLVPDGAFVGQGDPVGFVGSTGASSGPHIHYEQLLDGVGQVIHVNGESLAPYPAEYGERSLVSDNGCP
jgi:hypothetical protein